MFSLIMQVEYDVIVEYPEQHSFKKWQTLVIKILELYFNSIQIQTFIDHKNGGLMPQGIYGL